METILLTGSTGFIGSFFTKQFQRQYNIKDFSLFKNDLEALDLSDIKTVIHCAALVHQKTDYPYEKYYDINVAYPMELARKAKKHGVKQFIFISTIAVYGEEEKRLNEETVCNPVTSYGNSKLEAENQLEKLGDNRFIISIIRSPMVYGKDAPGNIKSLLKLIRQIPVLPFSKIENKRSFVYIGNLCEIIHRIIQTKKKGIFLASDDKPISTTMLIQLISKAMGKKTILIKIPFFEVALKVLKPSIHKRLYGDLIVDNTVTKQKLNFENRYTTDAGINLMVKGDVCVKKQEG